MNVIVLCEESGIVSEAFRKRGHLTYSCDLLPSRGNQNYHLQMDAIQAINYKSWDLMIAHPPCRYLAFSGVKHLWQGGKRYNGRGVQNPKDENRWKEMRKGAAFFRALLDCSIPKRVVENSKMHPYALGLCGEPDQIVQPWQHGHGEVKGIVLWLRGLPLLQPTNVVDGRKPVCHYQSPGIVNGLTREQRRSETYRGVAEAFAEQWG